MATTKIFKALTKAGEDFSDLAEEAKEHSNAANRQKKVFKDAFVVWLKTDQPGEGAMLRVADKIYAYGVSVKDAISAETWLEKYENEEITRQQFLEGVSVSKTTAVRVLGGDQAELLSEKVRGTSADIRTVETLEEMPKATFEVILPKKTKPATGPALKPIRKIKVKTGA